MERILKELKSITSTDAYNSCKATSLIFYLAGLSEEEIITTEIEAASKICYCALTRLYEDYKEAVKNILKEEKQYIIVNDKSSQSSYKIFIRNKWLFRLIVINSVKHSTIINGGSKNDASFLNFIIGHIIDGIIVVKPLSLHLLRTLLLIVTKYSDILSPTSSQVILKCMNKIMLSSITAFKQHARAISKVVITSLPHDGNILDVTLLPIRAVDMCDIVNCFSQNYIRDNEIYIIKKVLDMFLKNVESKDGGCLYDCVLFYEFEEWKMKIWPLFLDRLKNIDYNGEFFQSLLKYWITSNICTYKSEFYNFLRNEPIDWKIKGHVLLESKRKGYFIEQDILKRDVEQIFNSIETRELALKIVSTYHKKSSWPSDYEFDIFMNYLYSNTKVCLEEDETRSLRYFISQIFLYAHNELNKIEENLLKFTSVVEVICRYSHACLKTDFFEVGAEIIFLLWTVAAGGHKDLLLNYKVDKRDFYERGENNLYKKLEDYLWWFSKPKFLQELINCLNRSNGSSTFLTKLFTKYINTKPFLDTIDLKNITNKNLTQTSLDSEKRIKNYCEIVFQNDYCRQENLQFLEEINDFLVNLNIDEEICYADELIFQTVLYLEIIIVATKYKRNDIKKLQSIVEKSLSVIENVITNNGVKKFKNPKILEAYINNIMSCMTENLEDLWKTINKEKAIKQLLIIIGRSNMKRPLSLSVEVLKRFGFKMEENFKIQFLNRTLGSLYDTAAKSDLKIRRSPGSRLVIHAMCSSEQSPNKPLLKWSLTYLLGVVSDPNASDSTIASALHSIEILISDNSLQNATLPFVYEIIVHCVELFSKSSWIVRNADLQLTRAIIDRFYGVCLDVCNRPKCVEDLFLLFPKLSSYFYEILSADKLDERAVLVFQFFSESQIKEGILKPELEVPLENFLRLFRDMLQKYCNHYGKMAARSYSALCVPRDIPKEFCSVVFFFKNNFRLLKKNIITNFVFLIKLLYEKYLMSLQHCFSEDRINVINFSIRDLLTELRKCDTNLFDFILLKVKTHSVILNEFTSNVDGEKYNQRLWLHNNIPNLIITAKTNEISKILQTILSENLPSCIQIKILTILISRFEKNEFGDRILCEILKILFKKSISVDDNDNYLLNCYFKTILVFYTNNHILFVNEIVQVKNTDSIYKVMIYLLYFSRQTEHLSEVHNLVESKYMNFIQFNEDIRNDIISTLPYLQRQAPKELQFKIFKLIFYSSLFTSTYLEAYKCIMTIAGNSYPSILCAFKEFFSLQNLNLFFKDKRLVAKFFEDIVAYIPEHFQVQSNGYYSEESDILVPKLFLEKLIYNEIRNL